MLTEIILGGRAYDEFFDDQKNIENALREFRMKKSLTETAEYDQVKKLIVLDLMNL